MVRYKNTGSLHSRPRSVVKEGEERFVQRGEVFEPTDEELARGLPSKFVEVETSAAPPSPPPPEEDEASGTVDVEQYATGEEDEYEIPGVGRVQGRENALRALEEDGEDASEEDGEDASEEDGEDASGEELDVEQYHTGHGWYEIPGAEGKVRGREKALEVLRALREEAA